ncbi:small GTP-binding domain protein (macronuclear) [Tetrahymena thermophila SB210]|uniref:Small GTP-binding domain protein n=1 Tax=Tetrahymena thermophila (strain SB210) TaxID=312017 RepID=W7X5X6_TETTS|nr:small GTP-binding domain protein [Tetrahymena thermophila SB210]EWS74770.1 small GTP-binding domain protein [Tetrahymena thermophila SB210]|eukprot:XP_012652663.1 small GTP-binding domain protein [Tetrahymena thermophila SB210]
MMKKIDIFGSEMLLRFNGSSSFHTNFGSFITIMIVGFISFRLFFIVLDVFQRNNPQVIYNERQVDDPAPFQASSKTFPIAFGMEHPVTNNYYIDESIYTITAQWRQKFLVYNETTKQHVTIWNITNIQLQKCSIENFQNLDNQHYYTQLNYTSMYCLPTDYQYIIQGDFPSLEYSLIQLTIQQCSQNCKPKSDLDFYLQKANFGLQLSDSYVDPTIKNNPFKIYSRDMFWRTSTQIPKDVTLYIRNNYVYSDFGWFFSDITTQSFPAYSYYEVSDYPPNSQKYFLSILFRFEKQKEGVYKRTYKNFNSIMSEIGGFTQSLLAIGYLFCKKFSQIKLNLKLINEAFKYEEDEKKNEEKLCNNKQETQQRVKTSSFQPNKFKNKLDQKYSTQEIEQTQNVLRKRNFLDRKESVDVKQNQNEMILNSPFQSDKNILNQYQEQQQKYKQINIQNLLSGIDESDFIKSNEPKFDQLERNYYQQQKTKETEFKQLMDKHTKTMKISAWEYFKSFIFPSSEYKRKKKIIQYSVDKLYYNLDIFNILKKFIEVEKLKRLLLDQDQQKLFDYLPKPTIQQDLVLKQEIKESWDQKNKEIDLLYQDNRSDLQKANDAFQAYQKIIKKSNCTKLDQKLIDLLDPNLLKIFQDATDQKQLNSLGKHNLQTFIRSKSSRIDFVKLVRYKYSRRICKS